MFNSEWTGQPDELEEKIREEAKKRYGWLSINRYGAICLNSNRVLFGDIDCMIDEKSGRTGQLVHSEKDGLTFIKNVSEKNNLCFRVYKTFAGIRLIEITQKYDPAHPDTLQILKHLGCDSDFIHLTKTLQTFRARLTPKPWRAESSVVNFHSPKNNIADYLRGDKNESGPKWQVAKFLKIIGQEPVTLDSEIDFMIQFHDEYCLVNDDRPLA